MDLVDPDMPILDREGQHLSVLIVVLGVSHGKYLEDCLQGLFSQSHPDVEFVYVAEAHALTLPSAAQFRGAVVEVPDITDLGQAANTLFVHYGRYDLVVFVGDNIVLSEDAIGVTCESVTHTQSGVVGGKVVGLRDSNVLVDVGLSADRFSTPQSRLETDEIDHGQYDYIRSTLAVPFTYFAVRSELFLRLDGFDPHIVGPGAELDFCWRAILVGEDVIYVPSVRLFEIAEIPESPNRMDLIRRNRMRIMWKNYGPGRLFFVTLQLLAVAIGQSVVFFFSRRFDQMKAPFDPWFWNFEDSKELRTTRRKVQNQRVVRDSAVTRLMVDGGGFASSFSGTNGRRGETRRQAVRRSIGEVLQVVGGRWVVAWVGLVILMLLAGRHLLAGIPTNGRLVEIDGSGFDLLGQAFSSWRSTGLGSASPAPPGVFLSGIAGVVFFGSPALAQSFLLFFGLPIAAVFFLRGLRPFIAHRSLRTAATAVYVMSPLLWNALSKGDLGTVLLSILLPPIVLRLSFLTGLGPYAEKVPSVRRKLELALLLALAIACEPSAVWVVLLVVAGWALASRVVGGMSACGEAAVGALQGLLIAWFLLLPWSFSLFFGEGAMSAFVGTSTSVSFVDLLRFDTGAFGSGPLFFGLLAGACAALFLASGEYLFWAIRWWGVIILSLMAAWLVSRELIPPVARVEVLLLPAAFGAAMTVGWGLESLRVSTQRRGAASISSVGILCLCLGGAALVAPFSAVGNGRFGMPATDWGESLSWQVDRAAEEGAFRTLFVGRALPGDGTRLASDIHYLVTGAGGPRFTDHWPAPLAQGDRLLSAVLRSSLESGESNIGSLLSSFGIRYVAVPVGDEDIHDVFAEALDLAPVVAVEEAIGTVFENQVWRPVVASFDTPLPGKSLAVEELVDLSMPAPVSPGWVSTGDAEWEGRSIDGVYGALPYDDRFELRVGADVIAPDAALGWAMQFDAMPDPEEGTLVFRERKLRFFLFAGVGALWFVVTAGLIGVRGRDVTFA